MTRRLRKIVPAGINERAVLLLSIAGLVFCGITSLGIFLSDFLHFYSKIYYFGDDGERHFWDFPKMEPLKSFNSNFDVFEIYFVCLVLLAAYFFVYHYIGSKSVYTMKRLKSPVELYVRCLAVPVIFIILGFALIYLLNFIYIKIYVSAVPAESLQPLWNKDIWRDLL